MPNTKKRHQRCDRKEETGKFISSLISVEEGAAGSSGAAQMMHEDTVYSYYEEESQESSNMLARETRGLR